MPSFFTHYLCGDQLLNIIKEKELKDTLKAFRQVYNLGTQGPDILFYYGVWPWTKSHSIPALGEKMHHENVQSTFKKAMEYIITVPSDEDRSILLSYLCGYACHYSLDLHTHPYIFYKSGFLLPDEPFTSKYTYFHRRFETALDVLMLERLVHKKPADVPAHKQISVRKNESLTIGRMYENLFDCVYHEKITSQQVQTAIHDMVRVHAVLQDRWGIKKKLLAWVERQFCEFPLMSSMIHPPHVEEEYDYLNLQHISWFLPWDTSRPYSASFIEMFNDAVIEALDLCSTIFNCVNGKMEMDKALHRIGNRSFSSGLDCSQNLAFRYYDCIFPQ